MGRLLLTVILYLAVVIVAIIPWWRIAKKAGYPGVWSLVLFVPVINVICIYWFAFAEWPLERRSVKIQYD